MRLLRTRGSGDLNHFASGTALALLPPNHRRFAAGEEVAVLLDDEALLG